MSDAVWIAVGAALGVAFFSWARGRRPRGARTLLAQGLVIAAVIYVGFAAFGGADGRWWAIEIAGVAFYGLLAWLGVRVSPWFLAIGWILHVLWDLVVHGPAEHFVPDWYPPACLGFDVVVALLIAGSIGFLRSSAPKLTDRGGATTTRHRSPASAIAIFVAGAIVGGLALGAWLASPWGATLGSRLGEGGAVERSTDLIARFVIPDAPGPGRDRDEDLAVDRANGQLTNGQPTNGQPTNGQLTNGQPTERRHARGVVLVIGDGMGASQLLAGRIASVGVNGRLAIEKMPVASWISTHSDTSLYTDSAAAAAAMATGEKTDPGLLARRPDGTPLETLFEAARGAGLAIASVTDTYVLDATPAAFLGHGARRDYGPLTRQAAASGIEVLAGVVGRDLPGTHDQDAFSTDLRGRGYTIARDPDAWSAAMRGEAPVAGFFARGTIADPDVEPSLPDLAAEIFDRVSRNERGFMMLVESEEADTGGHYNDFERVARGVVALDRAVARLIEAAAETGDVLIVVTADHETGGLGLTGGGENGNVRVRWATDGHTAEPVPLFATGPGAERFARARDNTEIAIAIADALGLELTQTRP